jgi:hypothetical protein
MCVKKHIQILTKVNRGAREGPIPAVLLFILF